MRLRPAAFLVAALFSGGFLATPGCGPDSASTSTSGEVKDLPPDKQAEIQNSDAYYDSQAKAPAKKKGR